MRTCQKNRAWKAESNYKAFLVIERKLIPFVLKRKNHIKRKIFFVELYSNVVSCGEKSETDNQVLI
jgi:hypothetical protein